jgi:hypothetical protein
MAPYSKAFSNFFSILLENVHSPTTTKVRETVSTDLKSPKGFFFTNLDVYFLGEKKDYFHVIHLGKLNCNTKLLCTIKMSN